MFTLGTHGAFIFAMIRRSSQVKCRVAVLPLQEKEKKTTCTMLHIFFNWIFSDRVWRCRNAPALCACGRKDGVPVQHVQSRPRRNPLGVSPPSPDSVPRTARLEHPLKQLVQSLKGPTVWISEARKPGRSPRARSPHSSTSPPVQGHNE